MSEDEKGQPKKIEKKIETTHEIDPSKGTIGVVFPEGATEESKADFFQTWDRAKKEGKPLELIKDSGLEFYDLTPKIVEENKQATEQELASKVEEKVNDIVGKKFDEFVKEQEKLREKKKDESKGDGKPDE